MVRPGSGRFGVGFWVGFWVGLRARDFPTERVLSRTPLIIRTVDQNSSLTTGISLLSLSDKSAVDVVGDLDVDDCATGSFCSSCAIPPRVVGGLWSGGV